MIMQYDWGKITPEQFEDVCYELAKTKYGSYASEIRQTPPQGDGGRDIEIYIKNDVKGKIEQIYWAECKKHKRDIDLDTIGKNVVLVMDKHINKIIYYSASAIRLNTKKSILNVAKSYGFMVEFCDGETLHRELFDNLNLINKYNLLTIDQLVALRKSDILDVEVYIQEGDDGPHIKAETNQLFKLNWKNHFVISCIVKNSHHHITNLKVWLSEGQHQELLIHRRSEVVNQLNPHTDTLFTFMATIAWTQRFPLSIPLLQVEFEADEKLHSLKFPIGEVQLCAPFISPLTGENFHRMRQKLTTFVKKLVTSNQGVVPSVFFSDIRGISGSGKSRLTDEIAVYAQRHSVHVIHLNCNGDHNLSAFRTLIANLIDLPYRKGKLSFDRASFHALIKSNGCDDSYCDVLYEFFINEKLYFSDNAHYFTESILHFISHPRSSTPKIIILDNLQCLDTKAINYVIDIIKALPELKCDTGILFLTALNTEAHTAKSNMAIASFLDFANQFHKDHVAKEISDTFICEQLDESEAMNLLTESLKLDESTDKVARMLVKKCDGNPFTIIMLGKLLVERSVVTHQYGRGFVADMRELSKLLRAPSESAAEIICNRLETLAGKKDKFAPFAIVANSILLFGGHASLEFLEQNGVSQSDLYIMQHELWIRSGDRPATVAFYHDNIYRYLSIKWGYGNSAELAKKLLNWVSEKKHFHNKDIIRFRCALVAGHDEEAVRCGLLVMNSLYNISNYDSVIEIGEKLHELPLLKNDRKRYFYFLWRLSSVFLFCEDIERGINLYKEASLLAGELKYELPEKDFYQVRHEYVNAAIHSSRYSLALEILERHEKDGISSLHFQLLLYDRYAVTNMFLGNGRKALKYLDMTMDIAKKTNNYDVCTVLSDYGHNYLKNFRCGVKMRDAFKQAVSLYYQIGESYLYRIIEIHMQSAYVALYDGKNDVAEKEIMSCMDACNKKHSTFSLIKAKRVLAYVHIMRENYDAAYDIFKDNIELCSKFSYVEGLLLSYADIAAYHLLAGQHHESLSYFKLFLELLNKHSSEMVSRLIPILCNYILLNMYIRPEENKILCEIFSYRKLKVYDRYIRRKFTLSNGGEPYELRGMSIFHINGVNFLY